MKIWHISDTHTFHSQLSIPKNIDMVIFSGDCSNVQNPYLNESEVRNFIEWFGNLDIKYKIFVAGNHDTSIERKLILRTDFTEKGIIYLENESFEIEGIKIWGSPITPSFGTGWAFNKKRDKLHDLWSIIPEDIDIVVTHSPPKGCLDLSFDRNNNLEFCGCTALAKRMRILKPKLVLFGHIHCMDGVNNAGILKYSDYETIYSNGSVVWDGRFDKGLTSNGNIFDI